jgi:TrmH family RNA methyltransferase
VKLGALFAGEPRLLVVAVEPNDPGNLGTIIRTADAVGADGVIVDGGVDPYNGKVVRASAGSLFHLPIVAARSADALARATAAGMHTFAADGSGTTDLDDLTEDILGAPTVWVFGTEAHGLPADAVGACERSVRIPISGRAESLNVAVAAGVCLYASGRAQRARKPVDAAP